MPRLSKIGAAALAAFGWTSGSGVTASYLVVAGGGGGGGGIGGGGGAGGYRTGTASLNPTLSYTVTVGAAGAGGAGGAFKGVSGSDSVFNEITSTGGGGGGGDGPTVPPLTGGSGGGGGSGGAGATNGAAGNTPSTSPSQGNNGGNGLASSPNYGSGGGGGASAVGANGTSTTGGNGGAGSASSITGSSVTYAGGGGGGTFGGTPGSGGSGGGGAGSGSTVGSPGTANLGGGGGGGAYNGSANLAGGNGGSGVVIISYVGAQQFGGGVVTSSGGNTIHTFTTSGTLSPLSSLTASYLIVAGGGGGGGGNGGGGAGGLLSGSSLTIDTNSIYAVTVGAGGTAAGASAGGNGGNSSFSMVSTTAVGGGGGGYQGGTTTGANGGSGGGGSYSGSAAGGTGTVGQGNNGGSGIFAAVQYGGGGGGGASAVGANGTSTAGGNGGAGTASSISGSSVTYAGGGGGGTNTVNAGSGGAGGGGAGGTNSGVGTAGTANTGGGGGGGATTGAANFSGGAGGSGVVIISYPGTTQQMAGGTVTVAGGNVIHTFTSSGYLTPIVLTTNSLRFRSSNSAYLGRTFPVAGNRRTYTLSLWVKRGSLDGSASQFFFGSGVSTTAGGFYFTSTNQLEINPRVNNTNTYLTTTQVFRDPSAWYHIVVALDTTQATDSNRLKLYVNGVQVTAFSAAIYPPLNGDSTLNNNIAHWIGRYAEVGFPSPFDGYLAEYNFIDGQALTPNSFGTSNGLGVWQPIRYGGSYGTNGFYLPFTANPSATGSTFAALFNGSNYISSNYSYNWSTGGNFTMEAWINPSSLSTLNMIGGTSHSINDGYSMFYYYANGRIAWGINGVNEFTSATGVIVTNKWQHVACVNNGGTLTLYVNGVAVASNASGGTYLSNNSATMYIGSTASANQGVNGYMSNWRFVTSAVYTGNFTPSSTPLTAITNTQLLTFQNSAIQDNSGNSRTLTNNGSVTTGVQYPFVTQAFNDQGPAGNNWTPNNIGGLFGSSYDFMTDVPTLTSATTANYGVYNPLNKFSSTTITNGNLLVTNGSSGDGWSTTGSTFAFPQTGKWYAEFTIVNRPFSGSTGIGIVPSNINFLNQSGDSARFAWGRVYFDNSGIIGPNNASVQNTTQAPTYTTGDIISVAFDSDNGTVWWAKNGTWTNSGNPATGTNPAYTGLTATAFPMGFVITSEGYSSSQIAGNWGQQPFTYTPPSGFVRMNTFNIAAPTIGATASTTANKYIDAVIYTGAGGTQTISGLQFQPDFIWGKARSAAYSNALFDSVRGYGSTKGLLSNATTTEGIVSAQYGFVSTNTSTGFTAAAGTDGTNPNAALNESGVTYVAWNWKANGAGSTNTAGSIISTVSSNTTSGFSIVTYTGNATSGATVGHGCQVGGIATAPSMVILKSRTIASNWYVYHSSLSSTSYQIYLNFDFAQDNAVTTAFNNAAPGDTTFALPGTGFGSNNSGATYVAYCFAQVAGYSAFGSYTGNGVSDGPFIYTGFRPRYVLIKRRDSAADWNVRDTARSPYNVVGQALYPNLGLTEYSGSETYLDILSNGFKLRGNWNSSNATNGIYIYMAFAENPFKYANARQELICLLDKTKSDQTTATTG